MKKLSPLLVALALAVSPAVALAVPGQLDAGFGVGGRVDLVFPPSSGRLLLAPTPEGGAVVARGSTVIRILSDGRRDPSFGSGGSVELAGLEGLEISLSDIDLDAQGRVVAFGTAVDAGGGVQAQLIVPQTLYPSYGLVLRLLPDGRFDTSFGGGDGVARESFGLGATQESDLTMVSVTRGTLDPWGRPLVVLARNELYSCYGHSSFNFLERRVARLTAGGELDRGYGGGGVEIESAGASVGFFADTAGAVRLVGPAAPCAVKAGAMIEKLQPDGGVDASFGAAGTARASMRSRPRQSVSDSSGRTLVLGYTETTGRQRLAPVLRLTAAGKVDRGYGRRGQALLRLPGRNSTVVAISADAQGRVLAAATIAPYGGRPPRLAVMRLSASGRLDRRFGNRGLSSTRFDEGTLAIRDVSATDAAGRLLVGAAVLAPGRSDPRSPALLRFLG